ncbi:MAG: hypothetical protein JWQ35_883, partial [Bacteriovoracaceae bacterium]|nr:hypothetical protein [Bacteriovoracaceae bacterium]
MKKVSKLSLILGFVSSSAILTCKIHADPIWSERVENAPALVNLPNFAPI